MSVTFPTWKIKNSWLPEANSKLREVNQSLSVRKEVSFYKKLSKEHQVTLFVRSNSFSYTDNISSTINKYK